MIAYIATQANNAVQWLLLKAATSIQHPSETIAYLWPVTVDDHRAPAARQPENSPLKSEVMRVPSSEHLRLSLPWRCWSNDDRELLQIESIIANGIRILSARRTDDAIVA